MSSDRYIDSLLVAHEEKETPQHNLQNNIFLTNKDHQMHCELKRTSSPVRNIDSAIKETSGCEKNQDVMENCALNAMKCSERTNVHELWDNEDYNGKIITREKHLNSDYKAVHSMRDLVIKIKSVPTGSLSVSKLSRNDVEYDSDQNSSQLLHRQQSTKCLSDSGRNSLTETDQDEYVSSKERAKRRKAKRIRKMLLLKKGGYSNRLHKKDLIDNDTSTTRQSNEEFSEHHQAKDSGMEGLNSTQESVIEGRQYRHKYKVRSWTKRKIKEQGAFKCPLCEKILQSRGSLSVHINLHANDRPFLCTYCGQAFKTKGILKSHTMTHTDLKPQLCTYCARQFRTKYQLDSHIACVHLNLKPFKCHLCKKDFAKRMTLVSHMLTHSQERNFKCETCFQTFTHRQGLHIHQKRHTGAKPYTCEFCGKRFGQSSNLRRHERTHTGMRPFICPICHRSYAQQNDVPRHMKKVHGILNPPTIQAVNESEVTVGDEVLAYRSTCIVGSQTTNAVADLLNDQAISGPIATPLGFGNYTGEHTTNEQKLEDSIKPAQCLSCGKWFKNENRLSVHQHKACAAYKPELPTEKTYSCIMCGNVFNKQYQLNKHMKSHLGETAGVADAKSQPELIPTLYPAPTTDMGQYIDVPSIYQQTSLEDRETKTALLSIASVAASVPGHWMPYNEQTHFVGGVSSQFDHANHFLPSFTHMDQSLASCTHQTVQHQSQPGLSGVYSNPVPEQEVDHYHTSLFSVQPIVSWPQQHNHEHQQQQADHAHNQQLSSHHQNQHEQTRDSKNQAQLHNHPHNQQQHTSHTHVQQHQNHEHPSQHQEHEPQLLLPHSHHFNQQHQQETQPDPHHHQQQLLIPIVNSENTSKDSIAPLGSPSPAIADVYYLSPREVNKNNSNPESYNNDNGMSFDDESNSAPENESINYDYVVQSVIGTTPSTESLTCATIVSSHTLQGSKPCTDVNLLSDKKQDFNSEFLQSARDPKNVSQETCHLKSTSILTSEGLDEHRVIESRPYHCMTCGARFVRKDTLETHKTTHDGEGSQQCSECGKMFFLVESLRIHLSFHHGGFGTRVCETCGESFSSFNKLQQHKRIFHKLVGRRRFVCKICGAQYKYNISLQNHMYTHTGDKPYICFDCGRGFRSHSNLTAHRKVHSDSKPFVCNVCDVGFKAHIRLHKHMETHLAKSLRTAQLKDFVKTTIACELPIVNGNEGSDSTNTNVSVAIKEKTTDDVDTTVESTTLNLLSDGSMNENGKPNLQCISLERKGQGNNQLHCPVCNRVILVSRKLLRGSGIPKSIGAIGNYECGTCNKRFIGSSTYRSHLRCHSGERPYKCDICEKCFTQIGNLFRHKLIHSDLKPFVCPICKIGFRQKMNMQRHLVVTHGILNVDGQEVKIQINKSFRHRGRSEISSLAAVDKNDNATQNTDAIKISSILGTNTPGIMECEHCKKIFIYKVHLDAHMRTHTGERPYCCKTCGKGFTQQANLDKHQRVHTGEKPFACPVCGKAFSQKQNMQKHELIHNDKQKAFACSICGKKFVQKQNMEKHEKTHNKPSQAKTKVKRNIENFQSENTVERKCVSRPRRAKTLHKCLEIKDDDDDNEVSEMEIYTKGRKPGHSNHKKKEDKKLNDKLLEDQQSSKLFLEEDNLTTQRLISTNKQENICALCEKSFTQQRHLDSHMLIHSHDKTYSCTFCNKSYKQSSLLTRHMKSCRKDKSYKKSKDALSENDIAVHSTARVTRLSGRIAQKSLEAHIWKTE